MTTQQPFQAPADWPGAGPIDLQVHDRPHGTSTTEWWYMHSHLRTESGRTMSLFASFFRIVAGKDEATGGPTYAHSLTWALSDVDQRAYYPESRVDRTAPELGIKKVDRGEGSRDPRLRRAMREVLVKGKVPYPDRMFEGDVRVATDRLDLDFGGQTFRKDDQGLYHLRLHHDHFKIDVELTFEALKPAARHGDDGVVKSVHGEDMFYYFVPRCAVRGELRFGDVGKGPQQIERIAEASGWYDHEFGCHTSKHGETFALNAEEDAGGAAPRGPAVSEAADADAAAKDTGGKSAHNHDIAWNWVSAQLDDGSEVTAYALTDLITETSAGSWAVVIDADGQFQRIQDMTFEPRGMWRSTRSFNEYPTGWHVSLPDAGIELDVTCAFEDQEFITLISKPAFWEGRVSVQGTKAGKPVAGVGYVERSGFVMAEDLDSFFKQVGKEVRRSVDELIPFDPDHDQVRDLIASSERDHYMVGVDKALFVDTMIRPIREITDRGGKSWRSYAALACCDVVGGDSRKFVKWLAFPEFLHVGSLIVDDVQDKSTVRRGGPTCHMIYGENIALNAGTAAYFMGQKLLISDHLGPDDRLRLYALYFEALRAGHAGQAFDLKGLDHLMDEVVATGESAGLEEAVLCIHRLKTAAPAASLARMGGVAGEGTEAQIEGLGVFFEAIGLAFQMIDDVLNLRGFKNNLKQRGEDLSQGKVTLPVAKAMGRMNAAQRAHLWSELQSKPQEIDRVEALIGDLEAVGAIEDCVTEARALVESAWQALDPLIEDSLPKLMLRAFGWYVLERHY